MKILVTGAAGFIGFHTAKKLVELGHAVIGIDNLNDYYDVNLKKARTAILEKEAQYTFYQIDISDENTLNHLFHSHHFDTVINLAAQAGVRYSIEHPKAYIASNLVGFSNILEASRHNNIKHLIYASSSSVYGANTKQPFSESDHVDHPLSLYAATKKSNEAMAHSYANLYQLPCTGLRFFTVYGPWGRPDMALFKFAKNIIEGNPIDVYNNGDMERDFTYIDDVVEGIVGLIDKPATANSKWNSKEPNPAASFAPYALYNIGNGDPVKLMDFIEEIEKHLKIKAQINFMPMQDGDVPKTWSNCDSLKALTGYNPKTNIQQGIDKFIQWYVAYYANQMATIK